MPQHPGKDKRIDLISAQEALERLREGNRRFAAGIQKRCPKETVDRLDEHVGGQNPFAIILGCSDSRGPVEIIFDQGIGDLFVIRIAGNIARPSQIGSIEYAVTSFNTPLVVVLGHSGCGAVTACIHDALGPERRISPNLSLIVDTIRPAIDPLLTSEVRNDPKELLRQAVRANVHAAADILRHESEILKKRVKEKKLLIIGAKYSLETGIVDFFDQEQFIP